MYFWMSLVRKIECKFNENRTVICTKKRKNIDLRSTSNISTKMPFHSYSVNVQKAVHSAYKIFVVSECKVTLRKEKY